MLMCAHSALDNGDDPAPFMDNINAIYCGRGSYFYTSRDGLLCCNTIFKKGVKVFNPATHQIDESLRRKYRLPPGIAYQLDKITVFYPDGRHEVCKYRKVMSP